MRKKRQVTDRKMEGFSFKPFHITMTPEGYPLNAYKLERCSRLHNQEFTAGTWAVYNKTRPVKILAGWSDRKLRVQFFDRPDTPIRLVRASLLDTGTTFRYKRAANQPLNAPAKLKSQMTQEERENVAYDAFEDGWW